MLSVCRAQLWRCTPNSDVGALTVEGLQFKEKCEAGESCRRCGLEYDPLRDQHVCPQAPTRTCPQCGLTVPGGLRCPACATSAAAVGRGLSQKSAKQLLEDRLVPCALALLALAPEERHAGDLDAELLRHLAFVAACSCGSLDGVRTSGMVAAVFGLAPFLDELPVIVKASGVGVDGCTNRVAVFVVAFLDALARWKPARDPEGHLPEDRLGVLQDIAAAVVRCVLQGRICAEEIMRRVLVFADLDHRPGTRNWCLLFVFRLLHGLLAEQEDSPEAHRSLLDVFDSLEEVESTSSLIGALLAGWEDAHEAQGALDAAMAALATLHPASADPQAAPAAKDAWCVCHVLSFLATCCCCSWERLHAGGSWCARGATSCRSRRST